MGEGGCRAAEVVGMLNRFSPVQEEYMQPSKAAARRAPEVTTALLHAMYGTPGHTWQILGVISVVLPAANKLGRHSSPPWEL